MGSGRKATGCRFSKNLVLCRLHRGKGQVYLGGERKASWGQTGLKNFVFVSAPVSVCKTQSLVYTEWDRAWKKTGPMFEEERTPSGALSADARMLKFTLSLHQRGEGSARRKTNTKNTHCLIVFKQVGWPGIPLKSWENWINCTNYTFPHKFSQPTHFSFYAFAHLITNYSWRRVPLDSMAEETLENVFAVESDGNYLCNLHWDPHRTGK